jgi:hypothetical protein
MKRRESTGSWWQTAPGLITAVAGLVTAVAGLLTILVQGGIIGRDAKPDSRAGAPESPATTPDSRAATEPRGATDERPPVTPGGSWETALAALEERLESANIQLSTGGGDEQDRVRSYMSGPDEAYSRLAQGCLEAVAGRRLARRAHLDMIDKWYTLAVGPDRYLTEAGSVRVPEVKAAIVKAVNEMHGTRVRAFEELVAPR